MTFSVDFVTMVVGVREDDWKALCVEYMSSTHKGQDIYCAVIVCVFVLTFVCVHEGECKTK